MKRRLVSFSGYSSEIVNIKIADESTADDNMFTSLSLLVAAILAVSAVSAGNVKTHKGHFKEKYVATKMMSQLLGVSDQELARVTEQLITEGLMDHILTSDLCNGTRCSLCLNLPLLGRVCFEIESVKKDEEYKEDSLHLMLTKNSKEIFCMIFPNYAPKVCVFHHICGQITNINIKDGELCASLEFNGHCIICDKCIHF